MFGMVNTSMGFQVRANLHDCMLSHLMIIKLE